MNKGEYDEQLGHSSRIQRYSEWVKEFSTLTHSLFIKAHDTKLESGLTSVDTFVVLEK